MKATKAIIAINGTETTTETPPMQKTPRRSHHTTAWGILMAPLLLGVLVGWAVRPMPTIRDISSQRAAPEWAVQRLKELIREDPEEDQKIDAALIAQGYLREDVPLSYELQDILHTACEVNGVPYTLGLGLIEVESGFREDAVSPAGCYGLTQLNPQWFPSGLTPAKNIETGISYLGALLGRYGDAGAALTAYNAGTDTGSRTYANAVLEAAGKWA